MNIFIDESGSFVSAASTGSWNCIAAYVSPEIDRRSLLDALAELKRKAGKSGADEVKLKELSEGNYFDFLGRLGKLRGVLFAVATDAGLNGVTDIEKHRDEQAAKIVAHKDKLIHETARKQVQELSDKIRNLAPQLYVQLQCQIQLISTVVPESTLYFVQRFPQTLGAFRWRIDQKNTARTVYEQAFVSITPPLLQTISFREPLPMLDGADYRAFRRFDFPKDKRPTYLKDVYGIEIRDEESYLDVGKLIREDLKFEDSKTNQGVQVADLLAAGVRRCLRNEFSDGLRGARLLGELMVQGKAKQPPIKLVTFGAAEERVSSEVTRLIRTMSRNCRGMVADKRRTGR